MHDPIPYALPGWARYIRIRYDRPQVAAREGGPWVLLHQADSDRGREVAASWTGQPIDPVVLDGLERVQDGET